MEINVNKDDRRTIDILRDYIFDGRDEDGVRISDVETALIKAIAYGRGTPQPEGGLSELATANHGLSLQVATLRDALKEIAFMGMTAPREMGEPGASFYRERAYSAIGIAARALDEQTTPQKD
jgi:hypothetical protein